MIRISPQVLEAINGTLLIIFVGLEFCFVRYIGIELHRQVKQFGWRQGLIGTYNVRSAAIAMFLLIGGDSVLRGHVWAWRHYGLASTHPLLNVGLLCGVAICILGGTCALRHFAPAAWGRWPWIAIPLAGLMFGIGMAM